MKHFNHMFTDDDILTLTCTLITSLIHMDGVSRNSTINNDACCKSALEKLINHQMTYPQ